MSVKQNLEFYVGNFRVDFQRNQIVHENNIISLEPKVLDVLKVLAESQGEVVSQQTLLEKVWPDTVVAPNALQRCIGQLRKALNDDGKKQSVIVTHPKRGYSLIQEVRFGADRPPVEPEQAGEATTAKWRIVAVLFAVLVIGWLLLKQNHQANELPLSAFNKLTPLTATDTSEYYSVFSPDGKYVAFSRADGKGGSDIWLKELTSNREIRLTQQSAYYGQPNWSSDGKQIAFLQRQSCTGECVKASCFDVSTIYVPLALSEPQQTQALLTCLDIPLQGVQWLDATQLMYIQYGPSKRSVMVLDTQNQTTREVYSTTTYLPYALSYSQQTQQLAVMLETETLQIKLLVLDTNSGEQQVQQFKGPEALGSWLRWYPVWNAEGNGLLFSGGDHLYQLGLDGELEAARVTTFEDISRPMFHPDGSSIAMTLGKVDRDLTRVSITTANSVAAVKIENQQVLARSIMRESSGAFQPNGDGVAFISDRSGQRQLWLSWQDEKLHHLKANGVISHFVWSPTGAQLAANSAKAIYLFDHNELIQTITTDFEVMGLYQWTADDTLLLQILDGDGPQLVAYDLKSNQVELLKSQAVRWAQLHQETLFFTDTKGGVFYQVGEIATPITGLRQKSSRSRFILRGEFIYFLDQKGYICRFDINSNQVVELFHYPDRSIALGDVHSEQNEILLSHHVLGKKEIVLLQPSK